MTDTMRTLHLGDDGKELAFPAAKALADREAEKNFADPVCLSWYDRERNREAPAHVSECRDECDLPGWEEYAASRGGSLKIVVAGGAFVFCYRPLGEFS